MSKQQLQGNLAEHQVPVEKLQKAARSLLEIQGEPAPDHGHVQETTGTAESSQRYQRGWLGETESKPGGRTREVSHISGKMGQRWRHSDVPSEHTFAWREGRGPVWPFVLGPLSQC